MNGYLIGFICFQFMSTINALIECPRPYCETCLSAHIHDAPGVGFDLTPSYGTASVHYYNGTVIEVAHIQGTPEYLDLMMRLSDDPRPHLDITKQSLYDLIFSRFSLSDTTSWGAWWRWLNKVLGRPIRAYSDVEIISELLQQLQISTEHKISQPLDRVAVATPDIGSISQIVNAALSDLNLRTWVGDSGWYPKLLSEADAVYAANGYGLCSNYQDLWQCTEEFDSWSSNHIFFVFYSRHALYASIIAPISGEALARFTWDEAQLLNFDLGLDHILQANGSQDALWSSLRLQLSDLPRKYPFPLTHILVAGESAMHPRFLATLRDALAEMRPILPINLQMNIPGYAESSAVSKSVDLLFAASRGAALYARRRQEVQAHCTEPAECEAIRERERANIPWKIDLR
ncbi:hypothetical protein F1880_008897 [Penicillium rolfsii]|nr:hypothetical protein F1880_008897 [Penicillium rolfsii]